MQGNIIGHQRKIKSNEERFKLSIKDKPVKPRNTKNAISDSCGIRF
jgi:hypothetical protein